MFVKSSHSAPFLELLGKFAATGMSVGKSLLPLSMPSAVPVLWLDTRSGRKSTLLGIFRTSLRPSTPFIATQNPSVSN